jgi:hypothetical protein
MPYISPKVDPIQVEPRFAAFLKAFFGDDAGQFRQAADFDRRWERESGGQFSIGY